MRARHRHATGISIACGLILSAVPFLAAPAKKARSPVAPRITAAMRAASLRKVNAYLEDSLHGVLSQPGALVPLFEQLYRLATGLSTDAIHMIHYGDSHTAADEWTAALRDSFKQK